MKIDPYKSREQFITWKEKVKDKIPGLCNDNSELIVRYLSDMENGINVSSNSVKGARSYIRLNSLRVRMTFLAKAVEKYCDKSLAEVTEEQIVKFFSQMRNGTIKRHDGKCYRSVADYVKVFKAFWHWYMKTNKKAGIAILDITEDMDASREKPRWVYLTHEQVKRLYDNAKPDYKVLIMFLYDTGIRSPTELINVKVGDISDDFKKLHIRQEIVKKGSFGRNINLMLCSDTLREYVYNKQLQSHQQLFDILPAVVNQYLKRLSKRLFGDCESLAGEKYSNLTMYDFRHCSCCYWLPRYKSESALKYRFGWRKSDKIHYYSELLGMKDTIREDDMLIDVTKTEIEKELLVTKRKYDMLSETVQANKLYIDQLKQKIDACLNAVVELHRKYNPSLQTEPAL